VVGLHGITMMQWLETRLFGMPSKDLQMWIPTPMLNVKELPIIGTQNKGDTSHIPQDVLDEDEMVDNMMGDDDEDYTSGDMKVKTLHA
jgi:hypothetical protein